MSVVGELESALAHYPVLLTVEEAAGVLRIRRAHAYELARRHEASAGTEGIPVLRVGNCLRVPRWSLIELLSTGRLVCLRDAVGRALDDPTGAWHRTGESVTPSQNDPARLPRE